MKIAKEKLLQYIAEAVIEDITANKSALLKQLPGAKPEGDGAQKLRKGTQGPGANIPDEDNIDLHYILKVLMQLQSGQFKLQNSIRSIKTGY